MKLERLCCPACGAGIDMDIKDRKVIFCPFCGSQFLVDDGNRTFTYNLSISEKYTDETAIEKARADDREQERQHRENRLLLVACVFLILIFFIFAFMMKWRI
ncbi:MAG: hypothetical protein K6G81_09040 [Lachnospiraceae bacterium]|nr:hypothetical protein [Lachnospiraceae bacterium]